MRTVDLGRAIQTKTFGFNVPCRQFVISAQITKDRRMPLVDEFILRALNIVETVSVSRLSRYFGFDGADLGIALADLQSRSLVTVSGEEVALHPSAKELFRTSNEAQPTITSVEEFHARVWFDLISQNIVASRGRHNVKHLLPLKAVPSRMDFDAGFAREAFDSNFRDYLRNIRNIRNADQWGLYAILDVQAGRYSYAQIAGSEQLTLGVKPKLETTLLSAEADRPARLRQLTDSMAQELQKLDNPEPSAAARAEYGSLLGSDSVERATQPDGFVDLREWLRIEDQSSDTQTAVFIGYPYIERNRQQLGALVAQLDDERVVEEPWELIWLRPGGTTWGVSEDLGALLNDLRSMVRRWSQGNSALVASLIVPASVTMKTAQTFDRIFDRGLHAKAGRSASGLEVLVVRNAIALVSVTVPLSATVSVPIGRMTVNSAAVRDIIQKHQIARSISESASLWEQRRARPSQTPA